MQFILNAFNLIGDSFYALGPVTRFCEENPDDVACVVCHPGLAFDMFKRVLPEGIALFTELSVAEEKNANAIVLHLSAGQAADMSYKHRREHPTEPPMHISDCYALMLGISEPCPPPQTLRRLNPKDYEKTHFAISPFSRSCTRHSTGTPNKTLDDWKWEHIIRYLRRQNKVVKVVGGPNDVLTKVSVPQNDYVTTASFAELEEFFASCALFVSVDNGLGHIASFLNTPMISLWPRVSDMAFIAPRYGDMTAFVQMEPNSASPAALLNGIRIFTRAMLSNQTEVEIMVEDRG